MRSLDLFRERLMERYLSTILHNELMKLDPPPGLAVKVAPVRMGGAIGAGAAGVLGGVDG